MVYFMENWKNPIKIDDLGGKKPLFLEKTPISIMSTPLICQAIFFRCYLRYCLHEYRSSLEAVGSVGSGAMFHRFTKKRRFPTHPEKKNIVSGKKACEFSALSHLSHSKRRKDSSIFGGMTNSIKFLDVLKPSQAIPRLQRDGTEIFTHQEFLDGLAKGAPARRF